MRSAVVVLLCLDVFLLAWTEMAWLGLRVGTVPAPIPVLVALVTTPLLVGAARRIERSGFGVLAVWGLTIIVCGLWGPAGVGVMPQDWRALVLFAAGVLPGMVVAARPLPSAVAGA